MSIDKQLRDELLQYAESLKTPPEIESRVYLSYQNDFLQKKGRLSMKKRLISGIIAVAILIPTAALATPYLADQIFGSSKTIIERGGTQEDYQEIEKFFQEAKSKLTEEEYAEFSAIMKQLMDLKIKITDENGVMHEDRLTAEERKQFEEILPQKAAPFFEKVRGGK
ncbi:DUF3600 domain-containing protein [Brevibacillus brevis]|uniref:DUF3600 domain-containing protein n=1 Tax=Brevibacillus brevis TaxID=1393 RepID=A0A2Z4MC79_BREBE|nr:DUF3600 domain-containing protein [Brevibacillus brevis]AWX54085.1 DUF3600 domain-containing protein [Brevibacillus brevis]